MNFERLGTTGVLAVGVALGVLVAVVLLSAYFKVTSRSPRRMFAWLGFGRTKLTAEDGLAEFASEVVALIDKQRILSAHASEYFNTIQGAGWVDLQTLVEDLKMAHDLLQFMMAERHYAQVCDLCDYLMDRLTPAEAAQVASEYDGLSALEQWRSRSRSILMKLVNATTIAAEQTKQLGITREGKKRRSTLLSLDKIRDYLGQ